MDFALTPGQKALRARVIAFASERLNAGVIERDRAAEFPRPLWNECAKAGLAGLPAPADIGGSGADCLTTAIACEALGYGCRDGGLAFSLFAHLLACVAPIARFGTEEQKRRWLPGLCDGTVIGANAMTEPEAGSDAYGMMTTAVPDGDGFRVSGRKSFCTNAPVAGLFIVFAITDPDAGATSRFTAMLVDAGAPGVTAGPPVEKSALRTSPLGNVLLENVAVPGGAVLGGVGGGVTVFSYAMAWERICLFAGQVGVMERVLERAIHHANSRTVRGRRIGEHQAVSHRLADNKIRLEAARLLVQNAAWRMDRHRGGGLASSIAKAYVSEALVAGTQDALRTFGGAGVLADTEIERACRDALASLIYSGTNDIQREIIARMIGL